MMKKNSVPRPGSGHRSRILSETRALLPAAWDLARAIYAHPETAYEERFACAALAGFLEAEGFRIEKGTAGLATAFVAEKRGGKHRPCVAFLAEMDALPGLGHACGHHLIAAASVAAAAVLARALPSGPGSIQVIACPAEEAGGGKVVLAAAGAFQGLDAALIAHPERKTEVYKRSLGMVEVELKFRGRAAHAAADPEDGINALSALIQTFTAVDMMRQQLPEKMRVHGIITHGGSAPNIIPDFASGLILARGLGIADTLWLADKVVQCARGAARATGARVTARVGRQGMYAPYLPSRGLGEVFQEALEGLGVRIEQGPEDQGMGSTDVGNVGLWAPVLHPLIALPGAKDGCHTEGFARAAAGPAGRWMLQQAIPGLALTGARVLLDGELRRSVHQEHRDMLKRIGAAGVPGRTRAAGAGRQRPGKQEGGKS